MNVIIVGAGGVGFIAAETLADSHDVMVVESDAELADQVKNRLNVSVLQEEGRNPKTLKYAIETHNADIIISTLEDDDSNLFICLMAKRIRPNITTVASITDPDYIIPTSGEGVEGIDTIISPELVTAEKMYKLCVLENALDYEKLNAFDTCMAVFEVKSDSPAVGKIVQDTFSLDDSSVFAVYRNEELHFQVDTMEIHAGDKICFIGSDMAVEKYNKTLGADLVIRDIVILGGTIVGGHLAKLLSEDSRKRYIRIIEKRQDRCHDLSRTLNGVVVVNGDFTEPDFQSSENIFRSDCLVSVTNQDDTNLLMCMSAQKYNTNKIVSRYLKKEYMDIFMFTGLDTVIGFDRITSNEIMKSITTDVRIVLRMRNEDEVLFVHTVDKKSKLLDQYYGDIVVPNGLRIMAIRRGDRTVFPLMDTKFEEGDKVVVFTNFTKNSDLAKIFGRAAASELIE